MGAAPGVVYPFAREADVTDDAGDADRAVSELRRAIECDPAMVQAHRYLGNLLVNAGDSDGAIASLRRAVDLDPDHAETWNNLGTALHYANRLADAEAAYRRALSLKGFAVETAKDAGVASSPSSPRARTASRAPSIQRNRSIELTNPSS